MTSEQIQAAAERRRAFAKFHPDDYPGGAIQSMKDVLVLADAYVDLVDADAKREAERALPVTYDELEELCVNGGNIIAAP